MHVKLACRVIIPGSEKLAFLDTECERIGGTQNASVLKRRHRPDLRAVLYCVGVRSIGTWDCPAVPVNVKSVEGVAHSHHAKAHERLGTGDEGWSVPQVLASIDQSVLAAPSQLMKKLQIQGLAWRREILTE